MQVFICSVCGHIEFNNAPEKCPVCEAPKEEFKQNDNVFKESAEKSPEAEVKHVPSIVIKKECELVPEESCTNISVRIGKTLHPMLENHYIQFIDCYQDDKYIQRIEFAPESVSPAGCIHLKNEKGKITIVENCNLHGYWQATVDL